jgi:hypothetical protein
MNGLVDEEVRAYYLNGWGDLYRIIKKFLKKLIVSVTNSEEEVEKRNDVCIYQILRYPPKSTPPTIN